MYFLLIKLNNFRGDLSGISAKTATLLSLMLFFYIFYVLTHKQHTLSVVLCRGNCVLCKLSRDDLARVHGISTFGACISRFVDN